MPRQFDLFLQNAQLTNNPNNTLSAGALANIIHGPPNLAQILENVLDNAVNNLLNAIDQVTGLNLVALAQMLQDEFGGIDLSGLLSSSGSAVQDLIDAISSALGHSGTGHTLADIEAFLAEIPFGNI